jgi:hypothetical protein
MKRTIAGCCLLLLSALAFCAGEPKSLTITGLGEFEGEQVTVAVLKMLTPHAGGNAVIAGGAATAPLINPKDRVSPWTDSGVLTVWIVVGDVAANKKKHDKTEGLAARIFDSVDFSAQDTTIQWEDGKEMPKFDLGEFVTYY